VLKIPPEVTLAERATIINPLRGPYKLEAFKTNVTNGRESKFFKHIFSAAKNWLSKKTFATFFLLESMPWKVM
jgi:hypothetical protein